MQTVSIVLALLVGAGLVVQVGLNMALARSFGSMVRASPINRVSVTRPWSKLRRRQPGASQRYCASKAWLNASSSGHNASAWPS